MHLLPLLASKVAAGGFGVAKGLIEEIPVAGYLGCCNIQGDVTPIIRPIRNTTWTKEGEGRISRSKHTQAQIIAPLKPVEAGYTAHGVAREQGVSKHTEYTWKSKYGGMRVSEVLGTALE